MSEVAGAGNIGGEPQEPTLLLMHPQEYPNPFQELEEGATALGLAVTRGTRPTAPQMGMEEWLVPAIVVVVTNAFFAEMGKDLYGWLKKAVKGLWQPVFGPKAPRMYVVTPKGVDYRKRAVKFGIVAVTPNGTIKLLLHEGCPHEDFSHACEQFLDVIEKMQREARSLQTKGTGSSNVTEESLVLIYDRTRKTLIVQPVPEGKPHGDGRHDGKEE